MTRPTSFPCQAGTVVLISWLNCVYRCGGSTGLATVVAPDFPLLPDEGKKSSGNLKSVFIVGHVPNQVKLLSRVTGLVSSSDTAGQGYPEVSVGCHEIVQGRSCVPLSWSPLRKLGQGIPRNQFYSMAAGTFLRLG